MNCWVLVLPDPDEVQALVVRQLGATALFAAKFRENAARSLLLPKRRPGMRAPLWQQRKRSADLLAVAARYPSFPVLLETYRECLRDFFDMPGLVSTLADIEQTIRYGIRSEHDKARVSAMPRFGADGVLNPGQIADVAEYVLSLTNRADD